jgi:hypothetical protein
MVLNAVEDGKKSILLLQSFGSSSKHLIYFSYYNKSLVQSLVKVV